ncbi:MAG: type IV conjugative transfer system coupling protein TraD [Geminicoccaceae bacterium]
MSGKYQIEALLRPPVELWSVFAALATALITIMVPAALFMPPSVAYLAAFVLVVLVAVPRYLQARQVMVYQRNLRRLPTYNVRSKQVPVSGEKLFFGRGFRWQQQHTQRLRDTLRPEARPYLGPRAGFRTARAIERFCASVPGLGPIAVWLRQDGFGNPWPLQPVAGGNPVIHAIEPKETDVTMQLSERGGHTLVLGTTGVGKTRLAEILITQDIHRGDVVILFDPKGDADLLRRMYTEAKRAGRGDDFTMFHLGHPELSARYNAIGSFSRITEVATRTANQLPSEGNAAAFKEFAWRFVNIIARALIALSRRPDYNQIRQHINDIEPLFIEYATHHLGEQGPKGWQKDVTKLKKAIVERDLPIALRGRMEQAIALYNFIRENNVHDPVLDGLIGAFKYDRTFFDKIVSSVGPLMEKLTTGQVAELLAPDYVDTNDHRPIFDWKHVIRSRGIVYVGLDALSDLTVASAVGNSMFADLVSVAGNLYKHGLRGGLPPDANRDGRLPINIHADEFNELIGQEFIPLLNKARGAGMQVTAYTQTWSDIQARLGDAAKAGQVTGNFNTLLMLKVKELRTAELLTDQLEQVELQTIVTVSGVTDGSQVGSGTHFSSNNQDRVATERVPMLNASEVTMLPKGHCFALLNGGELWKVRLPLLDANDDHDMPASIVEMTERMRQAYTTNDFWHVDQDWTSAMPQTA